MRIDNYFGNTLVKKGFQGFKDYFKMYRHDKKIENEFEEVAVSHQLQRVLKGCFIQWRAHIKEVAIPNRLKNEMASGRI